MRHKSYLLGPCIMVASALIPAILCAQDLEQGIQDSKQQSSLTVAGAQAPDPPRRAAFFQNDFLRVEVASIAVTKSKNRVSLSLVLQNISSQAIYLAMDRSYYYCRASVTDNLGTVVPTKNYGQDVFVTGLPCIRGGAEEQQEYARFDPGSKTSIVIAFENEHERFEGDVFSISTDLLRFDGGSWSKFSMGISDIKVQK